ncbi:MAG: hypothetical protein MZV70_65785 [Desulfobacterales bacterium]|nr:hypothetical protein [Desulfobacterales bacterium]
MLTLAVTDGGEKIAGEIRSMLESVKQEGVDILGPIDLHLRQRNRITGSCRSFSSQKRGGRCMIRPGHS